MKNNLAKKLYKRSLKGYKRDINYRRKLIISNYKRIIKELKKVAKDGYTSQIYIENFSFEEWYIATRLFRYKHRDLVCSYEYIYEKPNIGYLRTNRIDKIKFIIDWYGTE